MAEIGDYVHYHLRNYQRFGITKKDPQPTSGISQANAAFAQQKQEIKHFLNSKKLPLKEIETRLNQMQGFLSGTNETATNSEEAGILKDFVNAFKEKISGDFASVDYNTLSIYANSAFSDAQ